MKIFGNLLLFVMLTLQIFNNIESNSTLPSSTTQTTTQATTQTTTLAFFTSSTTSQRTTSQNPNTLPTYKFLSKDKFYSFGPDAGDKVLFKNDDSFIGPIDITNFVFFNKSYTSVYVNTNGLISFDQGISSFTPIPFPILNVIGVAPFWNDIDTRVGGDIYYREITDTKTFNDIAADVRRAFSTFINFRPTWAYIVTWDEVAAYGSANPAVNNTFQAIITTNGRHSFTIFNYGQLMWSQASSTTETHAQAGFNSGNNQSYYVIEGSFSQNVLNISEKSNIDIPGKWIFRIDDSSIVEGGCNTQGFVTIEPRSVFFAGGESIIVTGPCFKPDDQIELTYDNKTKVNCKVVDSTESICEVVYLNRIGRIPIKLTVNNNSTFEGYVLSNGNPLKTELNGVDFFYTKDDLLDELTIEWNTNKLNNKTFDLYYLEVNNENTNLKLISSNLLQNYTNVDLKELIEMSNIQEDLHNCFLLLTESVQVLDEARNVIKVKRWLKKQYFNVINKIKLESQLYFTEKCQIWHAEQPDPAPFLNGLPPCWRSLPLTNGQIPERFGEFYQDPACNQNKPQGCQTFHSGANVCFRSITSFTFEQHTAGQQCCYDRNNVLLVGPPGGGTLDLSHSNLDFLGHIKNDVIPYYYCCKLSPNCDLYYEQRPSDNGDRWTPPSPGGGSGDPHFITLDKQEYTFNGYGEYTLLKIDDINFEIQVRMTPFVNRDRNLKQFSEGTVFTGLAAKGDPQNYDSIQIELTKQNSIVIYVNGQIFDLDEDQTELILNGVFLNINSNRYDIQFINGININIRLTENKDALLIFTSVPKRFTKKTLGLLGYMDENASNDFMAPNGTVLSIEPDNDMEIFNRFGKLWQNTELNTIFTYTDGSSHSDYFNNNYLPKFMSNGITFEDPGLEIIANAKCGSNKKCLYDISATGKLEIADLTLELENQIETFNNINEEIKKTCVPLNFKFDNGEIYLMEETSLRNNLTYQFTCNTDYCSDVSYSMIKCINGVYDKNTPVCLTCESIYAGLSNSNFKMSSSFHFYYLVFILFVYIF